MPLLQPLNINTSLIFIVLVQTFTFLNCEYTTNISTTICIPKEHRTDHNPPNCVIQVSGDSPDDNVYTCVGYSAIKVGVEFSKSKIELICTANYKMAVNVRFLDGFTSELDARIQSEFLYNEDELMYRNIIRIKPHYLGRRSVRYSISSDDITNTETIVLLLYKLIDTQLYWLPEESNAETSMIVHFPMIKAITETVLIPCIHYGNNTNVLWREVNTGDGWEPLPVDGSILMFEPSSGFILNTTLYPQYKSYYNCWMKDIVWQGTGYAFSIEDEPHNPEFIVTPNLKKVAYYTHAWSEYSDLSLECLHKKSVELYGTIFFKNGSTIPISETANSTSGKFSLIVRYQNKHLQPNDRVIVYVREVASEKIVHTWDVNIFDIEEGGPDGSLRLQRDTSETYFYCSSNTLYVASLKYILCNTRTQCRLIQSCLEKDPTHPCNRYTSVDVGRSLTCNYEEGHESALSCQAAAIPGDGILICSAGNRPDHKFVQMRFKGHDQNQYFTDEDAPDDAKIMTQVVADENEKYLRTNFEYLFECKAKRFFTEGEFYWFLELRNGSKVSVRAQQDLAFVSSDLRTHIFDMAIASANVTFFSTEIVGVICSAPTSESGDWISSELDVNILESRSPEIQTGDKFEFKVGKKNQRITCDSTGVPNPLIEWSLKNELNISSDVIIEGNTLKFQEFESSMSGVYVCNASNVLGWVIKEIEVSEENDMLPLIIGLISGLALLIILVPVATITYYRRKMNTLNPEDVNEFFHGVPEEDSSEDSKKPIAENKPYPIEFEIEKDRLIVFKTKSLGSGEFGEVYLGKLSTESRTSFIQVAVKSPKPQCPKEMFKIILSELKIMAYIGQHENIVQLIGAYTAEIGKGVLFMVIELCDLGSLEEFLQNNREKYGNEDLPAMKDLPIGEYQTLDQVVSNFMFGYRDLLKWSYEISAGMEFLAYKNVIHADLATRNILLSSDRTAKIADFGLSRQMYHYKNYIKSKEVDVALPWRWMAIESLTSRIFSTQSDMWSFGITLWEMFSLGNLPYPGLDWSITFGNQLKLGLRNIQPEQATFEIYQIMVDCWNSNPEHRPTFAKLKEVFGNMVLKGGSEFESGDMEKLSHYMIISTQSED